MAYAKAGEDEPIKFKVINFIQTLERWRFISQTASLSQLITIIYEQSLYYDFVIGLPHGYLRKANLDVFVDKASLYERSTKKGLYGFVNYIDRMQALGKHFGKAKMVTANEDVVRIMSIHKSKGLEFPVVFVAHLHKKFNEQDESGNYIIHKKYGVAVKYIDPILRLKQKTIAQSVVSEMIHREMLAEEMRLLYVAMTRAKSKLIFTGVFDVEKKIASMAPVVTESDWLLPATHRLKAKNYADWILPAILKHPSTKELGEQYLETHPAYLSDPSSWGLRIITEHETLEETTTDLTDALVSVPNVDVEKLFSRHYSYQPLVQINAKQSVSQRKEAEAVFMFKGIPEVKPQVIYDH